MACSQQFVDSSSIMVEAREKQNTVGGESYVCEKFHEFREFSLSRETFPPVHFKFHWNQQCIVEIAKHFHRYTR